VAYDGAAAQWDAYHRFQVNERNELILLTTSIERVSCYTKNTITTAVSPFIRFGTETNRSIWAFLHQVLTEYERCCNVFGGLIERNHDDTMHSVFSPQSAEATKNMKKQIRNVVNRLDEGREWAQNIISDTMLYGTLNSNAGRPIDQDHWQRLIDHAFDNSTDKIAKDFDALRAYTQRLRERRILERQQPPQAVHPSEVHEYDQDAPPDEYNHETKPDHPDNLKSDESYSDDSYHNTHDGYAIPKKASFYTSICSDQNPTV
jgi:hypothetical protein